MPHVAILGTALTTHAAHPFSLFIAGTDVIAPVGSTNKGVPIESITITEAGVNVAGEMSFTFEDAARAYSFGTMAEVVLWDEGQGIPLFGGFVVRRQKVPALGNQGTAVRFTCTGYDPLLDQRVVPAFAVGAGWSDQAIIQALVGQFGGPIRALGSTISNTNASMPPLAFTNVTLRQAIEQVADAAGVGRVMWIDSLRRLWYTNASALVAPFGVSDNPGSGQVAVENHELETEERVVTSVYVVGANAAGSGWVRDTDAIRDIGYDFQAFLNVDTSDTAAKRNSLGAAYLGRVAAVVTRGSFEITGADGWRPGQIVTITDAALGLVAATYQIAGVTSTIEGGSGVRTYRVEYGALSASLARALGLGSGVSAVGALSAALSSVAGTVVNSASLEITDAAGQSRVLLGAIGGDDYGLKVVSSDGTTVIIDGTSDVFKVAATGTAAVAGVDGSGSSGGSGSTTVTLSTGLTYSPVSAFWIASVTGLIPTPYYTWDISNGFPNSGHVFDDYHGQSMVVNTNQTQVTMYLGTRLNRSGGTTNFRYYVFEEIAF
jgi:hypothetical protein